MKKKRLFLILSILLVFIFSTSGLSYETLITAKIPIEDNLTGLSINPTTGTAVAISSETNTLYLIDILTNTIIKKIPLEITPSGVAVDALRNIAIVSSKDGNLYFIDPETGNLIKTVSPLSHSGLDPESKAINSIVINKETDSLFICNNNSLMLMDLETEDIINEISLPDIVRGMEIDSSLGYLLMIIEGKEGLSLYDTDTLEPITEINPPSPPFSKGGMGGFSGVAVNPSTHIAVLINDLDSSISIISLENKNLLDTIHLYEKPDVITIDPTRNIALIAHKEGIATVKLENPIPQIDNLIPKSSRAGESGFMLSIEGLRFVRDSQARFNQRDVL